MALYKGNTASLNAAIVDESGKPTLNFLTAFNGLVDRVKIDVYIGSGAPNVALGEEGDTYIDIVGVTYYTKTSSTAWSASTALDNNANTIRLISPLY